MDFYEALEITEGKKIVDCGIEIMTFKKEITSCNILSVEVGTTGYKGGDSGHGCRTYFSIKDEGSTDINVDLIDSDGPYADTVGFEVYLGGDTELQTFVEALEFATEALKQQIAKNEKDKKFLVESGIINE